MEKSHQLSLGNASLTFYAKAQCHHENCKQSYVKRIHIEAYVFFFETLRKKAYLDKEIDR